MTADELWRLPGDGLRRELTRAGVRAGAETGLVIARDPDTVRAPDAAIDLSDAVAGWSFALAELSA